MYLVTLVLAAGETYENIRGVGLHVHVCHGKRSWETLGLTAGTLAVSDPSLEKGGG